MDVRKKLLYALGGLAVAANFVYFSYVFEGCGQPQPYPVPAPTSPPTNTTCDGTSPLGSTKDVGCKAPQVGQHIIVCTDQGWKDVANTCSASTCGKVVYADVQPIFQSNCATCHSVLTTYATAKSWSQEINRRVGLPTSNNDHMPKGTAPQLNQDQIQKLQKWVTDGALESCTQAAAPVFLNEDYIVSQMLKDASSLSVDDRRFTRYLVTAHAIDAGLKPDELKAWTWAMDKALNGLNAVTQDAFKIQQVDSLGAVWRWDARSFGFNLRDLLEIELADVNINIVDNTTKGLTLQQLLGTKKPWLHADNFIDLTYRNSNLYYRLTRVPPKLSQLQKNIGVNFLGDLGRLDANFIGSQSSPIAEQKNRLLVRVVENRSQDAYYWQTFDVNDVPANVIVNGQVKDSKNLFQFPLLAGTGGVELFTFDASEVIFTLPNGMQAYALFDAKGNRLNAADPNVVIDTQTPLGNRVINAANSCVRCHNQGLLQMQDQVLAHVLANADQFLANDVQIIKTLYKASTAGVALFNKDNATFGAAMKKIGVDTAKPDPMSIVTDRFLQNWDEKQVASLLFLTIPEFETALNTSATAKGQMGQLLTGGTVGFTQLVQALPQLLIDARLFQDTLNP